MGAQHWQILAMAQTAVRAHIEVAFNVTCHFAAQIARLCSSDEHLTNLATSSSSIVAAQIQRTPAAVRISRDVLRPMP
jgi:hypothetical protein